MSDSVKIRIEGDDRNYESTLKGLEGKTKKAMENISKDTRKAINTEKEALESISGAAKGLSAAAATASAAVLGAGVSYNSQIQQYKAGFETMLSGEAEAEKLLEQMRTFAEATPFELSDIAKAGTTLLAFGEDAQSLMGNIEMLGDISLGSKEKFSALALVFGQVKSQGRLLGQDLLQMINAGFNPLTVISEKTGESIADLKDKMSQGRISFEDVAEAMRGATAEGGRFHNAMELQSQTLSGQFSTLKDNVVSLAGEVSEGLSGYLTNTVIPALIQKTEELKAAWEDGSLREQLGVAAAAITSFGIAAAGLNIALIVKDIRNLAAGVEGYTAVTKTAATVQKLFNAAQSATPWGLALSGVSALIGGIAAYETAARSAKDETERLTEVIEENRSEYESSLKTIDKALNEKKAEAKTAQSLKEKLYSLESQMKSSALSEELATKKREEFNAVAKELDSIIPGIISHIGTETDSFALQRKEIDALVTSYRELSVAKAYAEAYQSKMNKAAEKAVTAEETMLSAKDNLTSARKSLESSAEEAFLETARRSGGKIVNPLTGKTWDKTAWKENWIANNKKTSDSFKVYEEARKQWESYSAEVDKYTLLYSEKLTEIQGMTSSSAESVKENAGDVRNYVQSSAKSAQESVKSETASIVRETDSSLDSILDIIENMHRLSVLSDKEYYALLEKMRNSFFEEGGEKWQSFTENIEEYYTKTIENLKNKLREFSEKLAEDTNKTYAKVRVFAGEETLERTVLADTESQNAVLGEYLTLLDEVRKKHGEIPKDAVLSLSKMNTDEAIEFLSAMRSASEEEFRSWVSGIEENKRLTEEIAKSLYEDEIRENDEVLEHFKEMWGSLPEDFFKVGADCGKRYGEGLSLVLNGIFEEARGKINQIFSLSKESGADFQTALGGGVSNYTDNRTTNIYASSQSPRAIAEASRQAQIYQAHTSAFGG